MRGFVLVALALTVLACAGAPGRNEPEVAARQTAVSGQLFYPERIALPSEAILVVQIERFEAGGRRTLARYRRSLDGEQVPLPIALSFARPADGAAVDEFSARVFHQGALLRDSGPVLLAPGTDRIELGRVRLSSMGFDDLGQGWRCGERVLQFGAFEDEALLITEDRRFRMTPVDGGPGRRYRAEDDESVWAEEASGELFVSLGGERLADCRPRAETLPPLTARGNEPGWRMRLDSKRVVLDYDYGTASLRLPVIDIESRGRHFLVRAAKADRALIASLNETTCADSATGMPHPWQVNVQTGTDRFEGCGGRPADLLTGVEWHLERLAGEVVDSESQSITLEFSSGGRVSGQAPCNRFSADYVLGGEGLSIERPAATKRSCAADIMALESRFLDGLSATRRFEIGPAGELILIGENGRLVARKAADP